MIYGYTGTQIGMSHRQKEELWTHLMLAESGSEFHHGDCIGRHLRRTAARCARAGAALR